MGERYQGEAVRWCDRAPRAPAVRSNYDDFSTIDWARDAAVDLNRKRLMAKCVPSVPGCSTFGARRTVTRPPFPGAAAVSCREQPFYLKAFDAISGWLLMALIGMSLGVIAGLIDMSAEWLSDIKEGRCHKAFWY